MTDAVKRTPPNAGKGRPKGTPNKMTAQLKDMILTALDKAGGVDYLVKQADTSPTAFLTLVGKVLPLQVGGVDDEPIKTLARIELVGVMPDDSGTA